MTRVTNSTYMKVDRWNFERLAWLWSQRRVDESFRGNSGDLRSSPHRRCRHNQPLAIRSYAIEQYFLSIIVFKVLLFWRIKPLFQF